MSKTKQLSLPGNPPEELASIWASLLGKYSFVKELGTGKHNVAYQIQDNLTRHFRCLKAPKVSLKGDERRRAGENLKKEVAILLPLRHQALPEIFAYNEDASAPFYICTYHGGLTLADRIASKKPLDTENSWMFLSLLFDAVKTIHDSNRSHCDLHSRNILIADSIVTDGILIIDFGSGHRGSDSSPLTANAGNPFMKIGPPAYGQIVDRHGATNAFRIYDFVALGHLLSQSDSILFSDAPPIQKSAFRSFYRKLVSQSIVDWRAAKAHLALVADPFRSLAYMERMLHNESGRRQFIPIPAYKNAPVGDRALELINTRSFQRLRGIGQLSFCSWFFPGATHTRFEHSIGVFHLTQLALRELSWNETFRERYTGDQLLLCLGSSLLHDLGHYPFAHMIEHYAASHFPGDIELKNAVSHSKHSIHLLRTDAEVSRALKQVFGKNDVPESIEQMLEGGKDTLCDLLNGPIDCDKMDYLVRDALHCGVPFAGNVDVESFVRYLHPLPGCSGLAVALEAVPTLESFLILQEQMLAGVYWHECIRGVISMFHAALAHIVKDDKSKLEMLAGRLKNCSNDHEGLTTVILPALQSASKKGSITSLVSLHAQYSFAEIYKPIAVYRHFDPVPQGKRSAMFSQLVTWTPSVDASTIPVNWESTKALRKKFQDVLAHHEIKAESHELLIDVPIGKSALRSVSILTPGGEILEASKVSHLKETIFSQPAAFASPIRVYASPRVYMLAKNKLSAVVASVEDSFLASI